jgi:MFS family permease
MLSLGIVLFEIPSNMILYRVGPGKWLTLQLFLFGIVSTFQAWQNNYGSFIATRFLLGVTESGFIPGGLWTISTWYTRKETGQLLFFFAPLFDSILLVIPFASSVLPRTPLFASVNRRLNQQLSSQTCDVLLFRESVWSSFS